MKLELENVFSVAAPIDRAWADLLDPGDLAGCVPSADLRAVAGDDALGGTVTIGPVAVRATLRPVDADEDEHTASFTVEGRETGGPALGAGRLHGRLTAVDGGTEVALRAELRLAGLRGGDDVVRHTGAVAFEDFARRLEQRMLSDDRRERPPTGAAAEPRVASAAPPVPTAPPRARAAIVRASAAAGAVVLAGLALRPRRRSVSIEIRLRR